MDIPGLPAPLSPAGAAAPTTYADGTLTIEAGPGTDLFQDPDGVGAMRDAPRWMFPVQGDFRLSARVRVSYASTYDAGVLLLWAGDAHWLKCCAERSPDGVPTLVSVATRGVSDDANGPPAPDGPVHLRASSTRGACALHWSLDGRTWSLLRYLRLDAPVTQAGFLAQSPTGSGCVVRFDDIRFTPNGLTGLRDGT